MSTHDARAVPLERPMKKAAVAAVFAPREDAMLDLLLIRRAEHPEDPWSGHMAFPGGRVDKTDENPLQAAIRETKEEVGADLVDSAEHLGELSHVLAKARGGPYPLVIFPHVFLLDRHLDLAPEPGEVAEALYIPFDFFLDRSNRSSMTRRYSGIPMNFDCYRFEERVIWGLTLGMLDELIGMFSP